MKEKINQIKNSWIIQHKLLILCMALFVALLFQTFNVFIPSPAVEAYQKEPSLSFEEQVDKRAQEVFIEKTPEFMNTARIYALLEYQKEMEKMTRDVHPTE